MKISSIRTEVVVAGGGLAGIGAAIAAARRGCLVVLVEKQSFLGGKVGEKQRYPLDQKSLMTHPYQRESGLFDELWNRLFSGNLEGNYVGQARVFRDWLESECKIKILLNTEINKATIDKGRIESVNGLDRISNETCAIVGKYFIDCTGVGRLAELCGVNGEKMIDQNELSNGSFNQKKTSGLASLGCFIGIEKGSGTYDFKCPDWVTLRWEENCTISKLNLMESLERSMIGEHLVEWSGSSTMKKLSSDEIAYSAWDYLKNRSPSKKALANLKLSSISDEVFGEFPFRGKGYHRMEIDDLSGGRTFHDSIALGRAPIYQTFSGLRTHKDIHPIPQPFEIPARAIISSDCKNLLFAGAVTSATALVSRSLGTPSCAAQVGIGAGFLAAESIVANRLPRTLAKEGYADELKKKLARINQSCSIDHVVDYDNLAIDGKVSASSTLFDWSKAKKKLAERINTNSCLIQFPLMTEKLDRIELLIDFSSKQELAVKLLEGAGYHCSTPGHCLYSETIVTDAGQNKLLLEPSISLNRKSWHYLEITSNQSFSVPLFADGPVGYLFHEKIKRNAKIMSGDIRDFIPRTTTSPQPSFAPEISISPVAEVFCAENVINPYHRPNELPQLWISQASNFKYPEFLEIEWTSPCPISSIEITFDGTCDFIYPGVPTEMNGENFSSLVRGYRIYALDVSNNSSLLVEVENNRDSFRVHEFDTLKVKGIELEILSTHGLNRAQVYQVRVYS